MSAFWQADLASEAKIPVAKPLLPSFDAIAPYLRRIDETRWYSNGGPIVQEFEGRLAAHTGSEAKVATIANATIGLALALQAQGARPGTLCMVPAWTFAGSAHAIVVAGLVPWMVDVDPVTWALEPAAARALVRSAPGELSAVMPVSPFGAPMKTEPWESFRDETGIIVVIDAAAAFDTVQESSVPSIVSLHATKVLGIGEGGFVTSTDATFIEEVQKRANFGFWNSREAKVWALNGKISEYAAAVGLAALDGWPQARADFAQVGSLYRKSLTALGDIVMQPGFGDRWISSTVLVAALSSGAHLMARELAKEGIETRQWWGGGLHRHAAFRSYPHNAVPITERLAHTVIGLPCWVDLPDHEIARVSQVINSISV
ncbi:MAG TPA: DegT/DnrJ/EryC1/StrS family aminotransferase [Chthoniobacterales bacterium]|nr:DegT/DnrJ/EryC1/StrS family aminotransferase [Chthoniobacterales bacterium]